MKSLNKWLFTVMLGVGSLGAMGGLTYAADMGSLTILSPKDGSMVQAGMATKLTYNVKLSPEGNHLHVYVDDQKPIIDRDVTGCPCIVELPALMAGKHTIVVKEARADHSLTDLQASTIVTAK